METYYQSYAVVLGLLVAGFSLVAVAFIAARIIAPRRPSLGKLSTYECGIDPVGEGWSQSQIRYYIYAFLYVLFAVESVFLFPWAVIYSLPEFRTTSVIEMAIFIAVLSLGLLYAWRKRVLRWV